MKILPRKTVLTQLHLPDISAQILHHKQSRRYYNSDAGSSGTSRVEQSMDAHHLEASNQCHHYDCSDAHQV